MGVLAGCRYMALMLSGIAINLLHDGIETIYVRAGVLDVRATRKNAVNENCAQDEVRQGLLFLIFVHAAHLVPFCSGRKITVFARIARLSSPGISENPQYLKYL
jgi:hypothetical protein